MNHGNSPHEVTDLLAMAAAAMRPWLDRLPRRPVSLGAFLNSEPDLDPQAIVEHMLQPTGWEPRDPTDVMAQFMSAADIAHEISGPRYFGQVPGGGDPVAVVGSLLIKMVNRQGAVVEFAPALSAAEPSVIAQFAALAGMPADTGGAVTSSGSAAIASALRAARRRHLTGNDSRGRIYLSDQTHHAVWEAVHEANLPPETIVPVATRDGLHADPAAFDEAIRRDRSVGLVPYLVVASAGTTSAGAVDPLDQLAAVAHRYGCWYHVDACVGFPYVDSQRSDLFAGIQYADSISLDCHKGFFMPYATGVILVRDVDALIDAHSTRSHPEYLRRRQWPWPDPADKGTDLSQPMRAAEIKFAREVHGMGWYNQQINDRVNYANHVHEVLSRCPDLSVPRKPDLSTLNFGLAGAAARINIDFIDRLNDTGDLLVSPANGAVHMCVLSYRTTEADVDAAAATIQRVARQMGGHQPIHVLASGRHHRRSQEPVPDPTLTETRPA
jgi:aromatic-L-amino-acid decarboxylase